MSLRLKFISLIEINKKFIKKNTNVVELYFKITYCDLYIYIYIISNLCIEFKVWFSNRF